MDLEAVNEILDQMSAMSDASFSTALTDVIKGFRQNRPGATVEETERFVSELRDWSCHGASASGFIMTCFSIICGNERTYPPPGDGNGGGFEEWVAYWTKPPLIQVAESLDKVDG